MRGVTAIHQLELSSHCNLRCRYCPSRHLGRPKLFMSRAHFEKALGMIWTLHSKGTQVELNLAGIGESTMHPHFFEFVAMARIRLGPRIDLTLATNGLNMTDDLAKHLGSYGVRTWVSLHRPERAGPAVEMLRASGALAGVSVDPSISAIDWAGQVEWQRTSPQGAPCPWTHLGQVMLMADGRFIRCCLDADARGVISHIDLGLPAFTSAYVLCQTCHLNAGDVTSNELLTDTGVKEQIVHFKHLHSTRQEKREHIDADT